MTSTKRRLQINTFRLKAFASGLFCRIGLTEYFLNKTNRKNKNNYIRVVNYHGSPANSRKNFERQIQWFAERFEKCSFETFEEFVKGRFTFKNKPGILLTFDDGFLDNYDVAFQVLKQYEMSGIYMISTGLVGEKNYFNGKKRCDYMTEDQLKELISNGSIVGCHTYSHHRMNSNDDENLLYHEITEAKKALEELLDTEIPIFCWCGGEAETYTKQAFEYVKSSGFKYSFMTNSFPVHAGQDPFLIERSNIETWWPLHLVQFQLSGIMDLKFKRKRRRVYRTLLDRN